MKRKSKIVLLGYAYCSTLRVVRSEHGNFYLEAAFVDAMGVRAWKPYKIEDANNMLAALGGLAYDGLQRRRAAQRRAR